MNPAEIAKMQSETSGKEAAKQYKNLDEKMKKQADKENFINNMKNKANEYHGANNAVKKNGSMQANKASGGMRVLAAMSNDDQLKQEAAAAADNVQKVKQQVKTSTEMPKMPSTAPQDTPDTPTTPKEEKDSKIDYEAEARKSLEANNLGKYIKEDGEIDFKKLNRSKVGYQILQALAGAAAGAGAGLAGQQFDPSIMKNGIIGQQIQNRQDAIDKVQEAAANKTQDERDLDSFTKQLKLGTEEQIHLSKAIKQISREDRMILYDELKKLPINERGDFLRLVAQSPEDWKSTLLNGGINLVSSRFAKKGLFQ